MKNQTFKAMKKPRDENPIIKLWHQPAIDNLLAFHFFGFIKLAQWSLSKSLAT
jgi:hypothetical protein